MADTPTSTSPDDDAKGFTLDLSTGKPPARRKRKTKGHVAVVQKTINLSTPKSEKPAEPTAEAPKEKTSGKPSRSAKGQSDGRRKERPAPRSGNSLADLLDPETLARLRGGK